MLYCCLPSLVTMFFKLNPKDAICILLKSISRSNDQDSLIFSLWTHLFKFYYLLKGQVLVRQYLKIFFADLSMKYPNKRASDPHTVHRLFSISHSTTIGFGFDHCFCLFSAKLLRHFLCFALIFMQGRF